MPRAQGVSARDCRLLPTVARSVTRISAVRKGLSRSSRSSTSAALGPRIAMIGRAAAADGEDVAGLDAEIRLDLADHAVAAQAQDEDPRLGKAGLRLRDAQADDPRVGGHRVGAQLERAVAGLDARGGAAHAEALLEREGFGLQVDAEQARRRARCRTRSCRWRRRRSRSRRRSRHGRSSGRGRHPAGRASRSPRWRCPSPGSGSGRRRGARRSSRGRGRERGPRRSPSRGR